MNADDISEFLRAVKEAEEIGLTPAEVWRNPMSKPTVTLKFTYPNGETRSETVSYEQAADFFAEAAAVWKYEVHEIHPDLERCARCKRETAPENGYKTGAGFFCSPCSSEFDDGVK